MPERMVAMEDPRSRFIGMSLRRDTMDLYWTRTSILKAVQGAVQHFHGELLDVGCGVQPYRSVVLGEGSRVTRYLGMDLAQAVRKSYATVDPDLLWDGVTIPLGDGAVDCAMATELLEHCPDPGRVLREILRVMRPQGALLLTVPFLWPLHDVPHDEYRYTPFAMERLLREAGFVQVKVVPMGGWNASMAQMLGLWVMRAPMSGMKRKILQGLLLPVVRFLFRRDRVPDPHMRPMITGLQAIAFKQ